MRNERGSALLVGVLVVIMLLKMGQIPIENLEMKHLQKQVIQ